MNRYYHFDGLGGSLSNSTGRLFVVPSTYMERYRVSLRVPQFVMKGWKLELGENWMTCDPPKTLSGSEETKNENPSMGTLCRSTLDEDPFPKWGYYSTPEQLDSLINWLNPKGKRELALINQISLLNANIVANMRKRCQDLAKRGLLAKFNGGPKTIQSDTSRSNSPGPRPTQCWTVVIPCQATRLYLPILDIAVVGLTLAWVMLMAAMHQAEPAVLIWMSNLLQKADTDLWRVSIIARLVVVVVLDVLKRAVLRIILKKPILILRYIWTTTTIWRMRPPICRI